MKNQKVTIGQKAQQTIKGMYIVALSLLLNNNVSSQIKNSFYGISASSSLSGIGFGAMYTPGVYYKTDKSKFELGLNFQKRTMKMSGIQTNFEYTLFDDQKGCYNDGLAGDIELFTFLTLRYHANAYLSQGQINREKKITPDSNLPLSDLKFSAIEGYAGFGLKIRVVGHLKWSNSVGFGGWKTVSGENSLYREYNAISLGLNSGLSYDF